MTREEKIEALARQYGNDKGSDCLSKKYQPETFYGECIYIFCGCDIFDAHKAGILAGIALRDAELLEKMNTDGAESASIKYANTNPVIDIEIAFVKGARWQHEQFMKAIKGDGDA